MGIFRKRGEGVRAPARGEVIALEDVPDEAFASGAIGDGFAVVPSEGEIVSPVDGEVVLVAETGHAVGVRTPRGAEILVHVGIDSVALGGEGFEVLVAVGDAVRAGDAILRVDLVAVVPRVPSIASPVVLLNGADFEIVSRDLGADPIMTIRAR